MNNCACPDLRTIHRQWCYLGEILTLKNKKNNDRPLECRESFNAKRNSGHLGAFIELTTALCVVCSCSANTPTSSSTSSLSGRRSAPHWCWHCKSVAKDACTEDDHPLQPPQKALRHKLKDLAKRVPEVSLSPCFSKSARDLLEVYPFCVGAMQPIISFTDFFFSSNFICKLLSF